MQGDATPPPLFKRIGIVGLGLIGGSLALRIRQQWPAVHVAAVDREAVLAAALERRIIDAGCPAVADFTDRDLVMLAAPVPAIIELLPSCAGLPGLVTDVGSTKRRIMAAAGEAGVRTFTGGHPMAGTAASGLGHADAGLFEGRSWMLVRGSASFSDMHRLERFVTAMGARPVVVDAEAHDRTVAHISHLPQLLALALMSTAGDAVGEAGLSVAGPGFRDMTRLAASPFGVWEGILETNADYIAEATRAVCAGMAQSVGDLTNAARMAEAFAAANAWRARGSKAGER